MPRQRFDIREYKGILLFVVTLLAANLLWKSTIIGDDSGECVKWFGWDITAPFTILSSHISRVVYWLVHLTRDNAVLNGTCITYADTQTGICIVWSCTALKQSFIWICIMTTAIGPWMKKLWFIPLGLICTYLFNILRILFIALTMEHHPDSFELLHVYVFKYLFYGMQFVLWLWWEHGIAKVRVTPADNQDKRISDN